MNTIKQINNKSNNESHKRKCSTNSGKSKQKRSHNWCFTWNNFQDFSKHKYDKMGIPRKEQAIHFIKERAETHKWSYVFQLEGYGKNQTPHLQGYIESPQLITREQFGFPSQVSLRIRAGTRAHNIRYCTKIEQRKWRTKPFCTPDFEKLLPEDTEIILPEHFYPWQKKVYDIIMNEPRCRRTIHWVVDLVGNCGKTEFVRHIETFHSALTVEGTATDIKYDACKYIVDMSQNPYIIMMDIPRQPDKAVSYQGIEQLKSGKFKSTKYSGHKANYNPPHFVVVANWGPDTSNLSGDRLLVHEICPDTLDFIDHQIFGMKQPPADLSADMVKYLFEAEDEKPETLEPKPKRTRKKTD